MPTTTPPARHRSRGASAVEYILVITFLAASGIAVWKSIGTRVKCKVAQATGLFSGDGSNTSCDDDSAGSTVAQAGPTPDPGSGNGSGPPPGVTCVGTMCTDGRSCFVAGTEVATPEGAQPIESLRVGDVVLSRDADAGGATVVARISRTFVTPDAPLVELRLVEAPQHGLRATPTHPFFSADRGWVAAGALEPGEALVDADGNTQHVAAVAPLAERATVYNFEVEGTHTYFVGGERLWVHNTCTYPTTNLPPNSDVYHATEFQHGANIVWNGLQPQPNAWGGGQLGSGFYTATTSDGADSYQTGDHVTLHFQTNAPTSGPVIPDLFDIPGRPRPMTDDQYNQLANGNDYFTLQGDDNPISQYKFNGNGTGKLNLQSVTITYGGKTITMTPDQYKVWFRENVMYLDPGEDDEDYPEPSPLPPPLPD